MKDNTRKRLRKFLNKSAKFVATYIREGHRDDIYLFCNVYQNGKFMTEHIWIKIPKKEFHFKKGDELFFDAKAYMYIDTKGNRK